MLEQRARDVMSRNHQIELMAKVEREYMLRKLELNRKTAAKRQKLQYDESAFCFICKDDECSFDNAIVICEKCDGAVHQKCYGIDKVPEGDWFCDVCAGIQGSTKVFYFRPFLSFCAWSRTNHAKQWG